ncbi:hypothetical protein COOONC_07482, partial [Cooperia oncophora]
VFSIFLFYWSGIYCRYIQYAGAILRYWPPKNRQYAQLWIIDFLVLSNFHGSTHRHHITGMVHYKCLLHKYAVCHSALQLPMEMPSAVFCSLLAGISAVIEIHYSIDFNHLEWSEKWSWAAADSVALSAIHAVLAFALQ